VVAYNAALTVAPADGKTDGTMAADGRKWLTGEYKYSCTFRSAGRIEDGAFKAAQAFRPHPRRRDAHHQRRRPG